MATARTTETNNGRTKPTTETIDVAQKTREQLVSMIQQGQQVSVDAAHTWVEALTVLPVQNLSRLPGIPALPIEATTRFFFDLAADVLNAQREFALQLVSVFTPQKSG